MQNPFQSEWRREFYALHWGKLWVAYTIVLFAIAFAVAWTLKGTTGGNVPEPTAVHSEQSDIPQLWTCAMHPQIRRNVPGKCPLCGMDLVPVTVSAGGMRTVTISPTARKLMRIETTPVERRYVTAEVRMVGKVDYDETRLSHITAWVSGRLDRLYVDYTGIEVKKGDHLVYIFSEELYAAQGELIEAFKNQRPRSSTAMLIQPIDLVASAREKLRLLGLTPEQIQEIEQRGTPTDHVTIYSPLGGIVIQKLRQEGDRVRTGDRIYTVADLTQVWVQLDAYESDLQWLRYGQSAEFTTEAYPGELFTGRVAFIDPVLDQETRTVKVRVNVPNEDGRLKPEMFVRAVVHSRVALGGRVLDSSLVGKWISPMHPEIVKDEPGNCDICGMPLVRAETLGYMTTAHDDAAKPLVIPVSAALVTGTRAVVYVEVPTANEPTFEGREIVLGPRAGDYYLVRRGLQEGELVVTNGNFKLDSALQISAKPSMMAPEGGGGGGHHHGGTSGGQEAMQGEMVDHQMAVPQQFRAQLQQVLAAYDEVTAAIEEGDVVQVRGSFDGLGAALEKVDENLLTGHAAMLWNEFSMLLQNDAAEGRQVATLRNADQVYQVVKRHIQRTREGFGLVHDHDEPALVMLDAPPAFQSQLARLWRVYQPIAEALAADDFRAARQNISQLPPVLASIDASSLEGSVTSAWQKEQTNLTKIVSDLGQAADINTARSAFALFSDEMIALVESFGVGDVGPIFELHCPMAFENRGASWLQNNDQTRNPYYGTTMLKCADRVNLLVPSSNGQGTHTEHAGQQP